MIESFLTELKKSNIAVSVNNNDLKVKFDGDRLPDDLIKKIKDKKEQIVQYLKNQRGETRNDRIMPVTISNSYPLSSSQRTLWVLSQFKESNRAYNMLGAYVLEGNLSRSALEKAFSSMIARHESLRTVFKEGEQEEIRQFILSDKALAFSIEHCDVRNEEEKDERVKELVHSICNTLFDLSTGPLLRVGLFQQEDHTWVLAYVMHHIISDGWSMNILMKELLILYHAQVANGTDPLTPLQIQYKDFAVWQQKQLRGDSLKIHKEYWLKQFEGPLPVLELPADHPRPSVKTYSGAIVQKTISHQLTQQLKAVTQEKGSTLFMGLLTVINALLYRYTAQEDIITGSLMAGRDYGDSEGQIGFYVSTLPLRTRFSGENSYNSLLQKVKQVTLDAYEHYIYPFDELVDALNLRRDISRSPLFDVMVVLQNTLGVHTGRQLNFEWLQINKYKFPEASRISKFDLSFDFIELNDHLNLNLEYNSDIYDEGTVLKLADHLEQLMAAVVAHPDEPINHLDYLSFEEKHCLLNEFNDTAEAYPLDTTLQALFQKQVARTPHNIALIHEQTQLTYKALDEQSARLSRYLRKSYNILPGDRVGIKLEQNEWMVIAMLAVLRSGAAYVPVDPEYPEKRINYIVEDSQCKVLIDEHVLKGLDSAQDDLSFDPDVAGINGNTYCVLVYTSGSTGHPKGVLLSNRNVLNRLHWMWSAFPFAEQEVCAAKTSISFVDHLWEIFGPLLKGIPLIVFDKYATVDTEYFISRLAHYRVTRLVLVPSLLRKILSYEASCMEKLGSLKEWTSSGEILDVSLVNKFYSIFKDHRLLNIYGSSEVTADATYYDTAGVEGDRTRVSIGSPIANTNIYILDARLHLVPEKIIGEICVGGLGVSDGYWRRPELTAEKFITNPFKPDEQIYRTGDQGRWLPDGKLELIGRKDNQIKIRGQRVELNEIESVLKSHRFIDAAAVITRPDAQGEPELVAFIVNKQGFAAETIQSYLGRKLSAYMIPASYVQLEQLPMTPGGKVDRKNLEAQEGVAISSGVAYVSFRNRIEERLIAIWQKILGREPIGVKHHFFDMGGHSLKVISLAGHIYKVFEVKIALKDLFEKPVLEDQARLIRKATKIRYFNIPQAPSQDSYPLSSSQRRLWILGQFADGNIAYNITGALRFEGLLDIQALEFSFAMLLERHEILRTIFKADEQGVVRQFIFPPERTGFKLLYSDLRQTGRQEEKVNDLVRTLFTTPIDFISGPMLRAGVFQTTNEQWVFAFAIHHIISDGWSMRILVSELLHFYHAHVRGEKLPLAELSIQYKDYAVWQQSQLASEMLNEHKAYWLKIFEGDLPSLELPEDKVRPPVKTYNGDSLSWQLSETLIRQIRDISSSHDATAFMGILSAVSILFFRYTGQTDLIIGTPIAGREHADLEYQVGFYANTLALRIQFSGEESYTELLEKIKQITLGAYAHQAYPFDELVQDMALRQNVSRNPLFDVQVIVQDDRVDGTEEQHFGNLAVNEYAVAGTTASVFDMVFNFIRTGEGFQLTITYNCDIYSKRTVSQLGDHLVQLMGAIVEFPDSPMRTLIFLNSTETRVLLEVFNNTATVFPASGNLAGLFVAQAAHTPERVAVVYGDNKLTYAELNERSGRLASYLKMHYDVKREDLVGIMLDRSELLIIAILGVLRSGAAYMPIDPAYPSSRKEFMAKDADIKLLITQTEHFLDLAFFGGSVFAIDVQLEYLETAQLTDTVIQPDDLAYVIYTSGSTGEPKGVMIAHRTIVNTIYGQRSIFNVRDGERGLQFASPAFDASISEIFIILLSGGSLYIIDEESKKHPLLLEEYIRRQNIEIATIPPACLGLLSIEKIGVLKKLITAGEPAILEKAIEFSAHGTYYNAYGPTESSICATVFRFERGMPLPGRNVPIGTSIANTRMYVLDNASSLVPIGVVGEICIGGAGLARSYLNRPDLTAEKFIDDPYRTGERLYKTGDLGRWMPDGNIEFIGRKDDQVKVQGHRIELNEIVHALQRHPGVEAAAVITRPDKRGEQELVAFFVGADSMSSSSLRAYLSEVLPAYMLPSYLIRLDALPLTVSGKIDRKQLMTFTGADTTGNAEYIAPRSETEKRMVSIWQEVLGKKRIGITDDFFELGGNSLRAMMIIKKISDDMGISVSLKAIFTAKNIGNIVGQIINADHMVNAAPYKATPEKEDSLIEASFNQRIYFSSWKQGSELVVLQYDFRNLNVEAFKKAIEQLTARHEMLRTVFVWADGVRKQKVLPLSAFKFEIAEVSAITDHELQQVVKNEHHRKIDLATPPLFFVSIYRRQDERYLVLVTMHHIITDGYSHGILKDEILAFYNQNFGKTSRQWAPLPFQYRDFSNWQRNFLNTLEGAEHREYWLHKLSGHQVDIPLPFTTLGDRNGSTDAALVTRVIDGQLFNRLDAFTVENHMTRATVLMGTLALLLHRLSGKEDIVIFTTVSGRSSRHFKTLDVSGLIGFFVNSLLVRNRIDKDSSILSNLQRIQNNFLEDLAYEAYPFGKLLDELYPATPANLLDNAVFYTYHSYPYSSGSTYDVAQEERSGAAGHTDPIQFSFGIEIMEFKNCLKMQFLFNRRTFTLAHAREVEASFFTLLEKVIYSSHLRLK